MRKYEGVCLHWTQGSSGMRTVNADYHLTTSLLCRYPREHEWHFWIATVDSECSGLRPKQRTPCQTYMSMQVDFFVSLGPFSLGCSLEGTLSKCGSEKLWRMHAKSLKSSKTKSRGIVAHLGLKYSWSCVLLACWDGVLYVAQLISSSQSLLALLGLKVCSALPNSTMLL